MECLYKRIIRTADGKDKEYVQYAGLSTESEPTGNFVTGSLLHIVDSAVLKAYNATSGQWVTQIELGGAST